MNPENQPTSPLDLAGVAVATPAAGLVGSIYYFSTGAGIVGLVWGFCALPDLMLPQMLRKLISKATRQPDNPTSDNPTSGNSTIRQPALHKQKTKTNKPKAGQSATWPTWPWRNGDGTCNGMSQGRSRCPRNVKVSNRGS